MIKSVFKSLFFVGLVFFGVNSFVNSASCDPGQATFAGGGGAGKFLVGVQNPSNIAGGTSLSVGVLDKGQLITSQGGIEKAVFSPLSSSSSQIISFFNNNKPYLYFNYGGNSVQGYYKYMTFCDEITENTSSIVSNCSTSDIDISVISNFLSNVNFGEDYYGRYFYPPNQFELGFSSKALGKSLWFIYRRGSYIDCPLGDSNNYSDLSFSNISSDIIGNSPGLNGGGNGGTSVNFGTGGIEIGSTGSAINYYEKIYGWDEKICYAGVDNVTDLYGTPVSFHEGSGLNIFQVFSGLYGNTDLNKMYVWLNSWLINHEEFVQSRDYFGDPHPSYLALYNSGTNQVDLIYTGLDVSPFLNNPVAIYFLVDYISLRSPPLIGGSQIVSYCNLKINNGSFDDIIEQSDKNNIDNYTEKSNINIGLNSDGTVVEQSNWFEYLVGTGEFGSGGNVSWDQLQYTGDINLKGFFDNAIDEMKSAIHNQSDNPFTGVLPNYIIFALLMVVLFKILKK